MASAASTAMGSSALVLAFVCHLSCLLLLLLLHLPCTAHAQTTTDPTEAQALNKMFERWGIQAPPSWNQSGDPCTGDAVNDNVDFKDKNYKILIKCDSCNLASCHINQLKVSEQSVTGPVPEELQNLTHLYNLQLDRNYLTGTLPAFIGKLTNLQYMTFGINVLTGPIPKEIGNLTKLSSLGLGTNYFTGSLPPEMGRLVNLEKLYIDNSGISGEIPSSFSNLKNLQALWAFSNNFSGRVPNLLGDLTNLTELKLYGNSFQGPLPSSLAKLAKLTDLYIGDLKSGISSLDFIQNMTALSTLVLRNCKISGRFPSDFKKHTSLKTLDLSFNNLIGEIPPSLFSLGNLTTLLLGNNSLHGRLPDGKSSSLTTIDVSYNNLTGSLPSWVQGGLQLNLVANNFEINESMNSILKDLNCLQKDFPCYDLPKWSEFAINCGGSELRTAEQTTYDQDNESLGAASYHVAKKKGWAVSNVGIFTDSKTNTYIATTTSSITNAENNELLKSSRISPSSLRYYGLGLENGNYTVQLQFAETKFENTRTYKSLGRRIFNIYIQGKVEERDFDIRKEAGNKSNAAISRKYNSSVTKNFIEIHLFWAGKGTCCLPIRGTYGPSISAIRVTPNFEPTVNSNQTTPEKSKKPLIVGLVVGLGSTFVLLVFTIFMWMRKKSRHSMSSFEGLQGLTMKSNIFSYTELKNATEDFSPSNKLGGGGFGPVFKGYLSDGRSVAVKQLSIDSRQGRGQFVTEIEIISAVQHRNLVKLYGYCYEENKLLLVYEHLEKGSLDQALFGKDSLELDWPSRFQICLGTARALLYLHEESSVKIVHRDVKTSNILLDRNLRPKISDFGLAKLFDDEKSHISTGIAGTIGYLAPEYALRGHLTEKADVYGFGMVVLEILCGRRNTDPSLGPEKTYLIEWAWHLYENNMELEMMDPTLPTYDKGEALRMIGVALLCLQTSASLRPRMSNVVKMLVGDIEVGKVTSKPTYLMMDLHVEEERNASVGNFTGCSTTVIPGSLISTTSTTTEVSRSDGSSQQFQPMPTDISGG